MPTSDSLTRTKLTYSSPDDPWWKKLIIEGIELATGRRIIERYYSEVKAQNLPQHKIWGECLKKLQVTMDFDQAQLEKTPRNQPLVFIANHPFGLIDGLMFGDLVTKITKKFVFPVNEVLTREGSLSEYFLPIDFRETKEAMRLNIHTRSEILRRMKEGEALVIFPAGGVMTAKGFFGEVDDLEWKRFVVKVIQKSQATVIPMFFHGRNSWLFQFVSQFSLTVRLSILLWEAVNKIGQTFRIEIGDPIPYSELSDIKNRQEILDLLKEKTFSLKTQ